MKQPLIAAALAAFLFTSCSEAKQETSATETESHEHHEGMAHGDEMPASNSLVVEAPDYTAVAAPVKEQIAAVLDSFLKLKDDLVASDAQQAQDEAKTLLAAAEKVDAAGLAGEQKAFAEERIAEVKQSASKMAEAADLAVQRGQLELLSEATFALTKAFGASTATLFYQHCPMANNNQGAYWLSADGEIRNPYFGESMLECGSIEEVFN
ncbi:DUF3347 domain-containing protein [Pontibacter sp. SGAir0037]|uniref:DUF3347 domain-containing protein n=1 Tax=Pontibacter sp. SGAir0037 TaxID=2571030 RepID=UPI0010CD5963|nr:DUF3347 domain-containing protein [Pontibacter sp. SGAir0037]QCR25240.1 hypothetical protein C1N53_22220 [Pontibacter sp. SGAir0037]